MIGKMTDAEIAFIEDYLKNSGVSEETVLAELTDHLCIITEAESDSEPDFHTAFKKALQKFNQKDLMNISRSKESYYGYPGFLTRKFFVFFGIAAILVFCAGLYLRFNLLPGRKAFQIIGAVSIGYIYFPFLLVHWLTEYANKAKCVMGFMILVAIFHAVVGLYLHWPIAWLFIAITVLLFLLYTISYFIYPKLKNR